MSSEHVAIPYDNLSVHFCRKSETILITTRQKQIGVHHKVIFASKSLSELVKSSFDKFAKRNFQKSKKVSLEVRIYVKTKNFVKNLFLHFVSWTRREKFWQPVCWIFADSQKQFLSKFGSQTRKMFSKKKKCCSSFKYTPWTCKKQFSQLYGIFSCQKSENFSPEVPVCTKNIRKFEKVRLVNWLSEQVETSFDNFSV